MLQKIINKLNDLRPKQLLMLAAGAAVLMFITIYISVSLLVSKEEEEIQREEHKPPATVAVVVAKTKIPPRTKIQENMLQMKELPVELVPEDAIKNFNDVLNVSIKVTIFAGDILTVQRVFNESGAEGFIANIPPECRAISISINDITGVAGFAKPGDYVDLILVEKGDYSATTNILLQNVLLLSINQDMTGSNIANEKGIVTSTAISNPTIATFALRPPDILKLISATKIGEIYMSLRPADPQSAYVGEMDYTIESITAPKPEPVRESRSAESAPVIPETVPVPQMPAVPVTPPVPKIEIIQGDEITQKADEPQIIMPNVPTGGADVPLPVIPSRSSTPTSMPQVSQPLAGAPFVGSNVIKPPSGN